MKLTIGYKLAAIREERKMTQADMVHLLGIAEATYSRYERNQSQVSFDKIARFSEILNLSLQDLLPDTMSIYGNHNHVGQGGGAIILGNQYVYIGDEIANSKLSEENKQLRDRLKTLEDKLEQLLSRLS